MVEEIKKEDKLTEKIIGAAMKVHSALGPGLLESAYEACLLYELKECGLNVKNQVPVSIEYGEVRLECAYRIDILVEDLVVLELKAVEDLFPVHKAQLISYLKLGNFAKGLLINFNVRSLKYGIKRVFKDSKQNS